MSISAMKQAYVALGWYCRETHEAASKALRQAIAEAEKQPVHASDISQEFVDKTAKREHEWVEQPDLARVGEVGVWGHKREWVGLTKNEVDSWELPEKPTVFEFAQFVEAKLKEKNT